MIPHKSYILTCALEAWCSTLSQENHALVKRLDALINVILETAKLNDKELKVIDKVRILSAAGLRPVEIASILGITVNQVNVGLHELRKKKQSKKSGK
jgi:DNA-binding CsgD family transcriptional regulator